MFFNRENKETKDYKASQKANFYYSVVNSAQSVCPGVVQIL